MRLFAPALLVLAAACAHLAIVPDRWYPATGEEAVRLYRAGAFVLDVSPGADYDSGHVPGALSIPLSQLWSRLDEVPPDPNTLILVTADNPDRAARAAERLRQEGYFKVHALTAGGFQAWRSAGGPVSLDPAPPPGYGRGRETWGL